MQAMISVIVPVYNTEKYLDRCISSILCQSYLHIEVLLIDDGSTDASPKKCDYYAQRDSRVRVIHKINGGLSSARNAGLAASRGEYISFIDSDDWIEQDMYATLLGQIEKYDVPLAVCGRYDVYEQSEKKTIGKDLKTEGVFDVYEILPKMTIGALSDFSACDKLYHRDLWKTIRFPQGEIYEDFAIMYKVLLEAKKIVLCNKPFYVYFHRGNSTVTSGFREALTDYPKQTQKYLSDIADWFPEYTRYAVWAHIKAVQCVLISLLKSKKDVFSHNKSLYNNYINEIKKYNKYWKRDSLFSFKDRSICLLLLHRRLARIFFLIKGNSLFARIVSKSHLPK